LLRDWRTAISRLLLALISLLIIGALAGQPWLLLTLGLGAYLLYSLQQLRRLHRWLYSDHSAADNPPPESRGKIWGDIFDGIYRLQRRERDAREHLTSIIDKAQESTAALEMAVAMINSQGALEWWNPAAVRLLGLSPRDRLQPVVNLLRDPAFVAYFEAGNYERPLKVPAPANRDLMLEYQITWFGAGERLMLARDITQLHRLETMRRDFVGNVSHELRTPITVIGGYLETLLDSPDMQHSRWRRALEQMAQQSQRMENTIRDLLTLSQLETKPVSRQKTSIDLSGLLSEILNEARLYFQEKQQQFSIATLPAPISLQGNRGELYSALSNLVFNAAKYTQAGGQITVRCKLHPEGLDIAVIDNGPGIESQHIPRLTERFYRVDESRATDSGGTGLGLAIVKHVLVRHNAHLSIKSEPGKGSSFVCHFPTHRVELQVEQKTKADESG